MLFLVGGSFVVKISFCFKTDGCPGGVISIKNMGMMFIPNSFVILFICEIFR